MLATKHFKACKLLLRNACKQNFFIEGALILSHWELLFYSNDGLLDLSETYNCIASVEIKKESKSADFYFKNFLNWCIVFPNDNEMNDFTVSISQYRVLKGDPDDLVANIPAFHQNVLPFEIEEDGWLTFNIERDLHQMFLLIDEKKNNWGISTVNKNYEICGTYPKLLALPKDFDERELKQAAEFRDQSRFPALSWVHASKLSAICRCAQPLAGKLGNIRGAKDEILVEAIFRSNPNVAPKENKIFDARPFSYAFGNRYKGAGYEQTEFYQNCEIEFMGIENIHTMRESLVKLRKLCRALSVNDSTSTWYSRLQSTGWLDHVQLCFKTAAKVARTVNSGLSVIIHCSHGWDRTAQLTALAQLMLDPRYRTIRGFEELIEKEWVSFGHRNTDRAGHLSSLNENANNEEESPIFLQFLDCVYQLLVQFPTQFEFNEEFLIATIDGFYCCRYGTFLCNSEQEKEIFQVQQKTISLWTVLNHKSNIQKYKNPLYIQTDIIEFLNPTTSANNIRYWSTFYDRSEKLIPGSLSVSQVVNNRLNHIVETVESMKVKVMEEEIKRKKLLIEKIEKEISEICNST